MSQHGHHSTCIFSKSIRVWLWHLAMCRRGVCLHLCMCVTFPFALADVWSYRMMKWVCVRVGRGEKKHLGGAGATNCVRMCEHASPHMATTEIVNLRLHTLPSITHTHTHTRRYYQHYHNPIQLSLWPHGKGSRQHNRDSFSSSISPVHISFHSVIWEVKIGLL